MSGAQTPAAIGAAIRRISPGPFRVCRERGAEVSGALLIEDADGEIIGWATDAAGHTIEAAFPDRRHPDTIGANASLFGEAHTLLGLALSVACAAPLIRKRLVALGAESTPLVDQIEAAAVQSLRRVGITA